MMEQLSLFETEQKQKPKTVISNGGEFNFSMSILTANTDEWYTPREPVELIVPYLVGGGYKRILCPFDKEESNFVQVLREKGFEVTFSHIETGTDFFGIEDFSKYDAVVSNPPFSKRTEIFQRLFDVGVPFALIMNWNGIFDSKERWDMFSRNRFEILVPRGRFVYFNDSGVGSSPNFHSVYICSGMSERQIDFMRTIK